MNMNKFNAMITASILACASIGAHADSNKEQASSNRNEVESVQIKKNDVPETTATGDYLKRQPANNRKPISKEHNKSPDQGGVDLES